MPEIQGQYLYLPGSESAHTAAFQDLLTVHPDLTANLCGFRQDVELWFADGTNNGGGRRILPKKGLE